MSDDIRAKFEEWFSSGGESYEDYPKKMAFEAYQQAVKDMEPKWISMDDELPSVLDVRVLLLDGSEINCCAQSDGDFYWKGGGTEMFILDYKVTHWMPKEPKT